MTVISYYLKRLGLLDITWGEVTLPLFFLAIAYLSWAVFRFGSNYIHFKYGGEDA
jgi:hypothetical protein